MTLDESASNIMKQILNPGVEDIQNTLSNSSKEAHHTPNESLPNRDLRELGIRRLDGDEETLINPGVQTAYKVFIQGGVGEDKNPEMEFSETVNGFELGRYNENNSPRPLSFFYNESGHTMDLVSQCHFSKENEVVGIDGISYEDEDTINVESDNTAVRVRDYDGAGKQAAITTDSIEPGHYSEQELLKEIDGSLPYEMTSDTVDAVVEQSL